MLVMKLCLMNAQKHKIWKPAVGIMGSFLGVGGAGMSSRLLLPGDFVTDRD